MVQGQRHLKVPVVMAINDVVMNNTLLPHTEYCAEAWNGVPLTVAHPKKDGVFVSASLDDAIKAKFCVGEVKNVTIQNGKLKGFAYVNEALATKAHADLVPRLLSGKPLDVSTGFFADIKVQNGYSRGKPFAGVYTNVRPNHLALLPDEPGACSWSDGCGVRANHKVPSMNISEALGVVAEWVKTSGVLQVHQNNPDQARDASGKFASGSGSSSHPTDGKTYNVRNRSTKKTEKMTADEIEAKHGVGKDDLAWAIEEEGKAETMNDEGHDIAIREAKTPKIKTNVTASDDCDEPDADEKDKKPIANATKDDCAEPDEDDTEEGKGDKKMPPKDMKTNSGNGDTIMTKEEIEAIVTNAVAAAVTKVAAPTMTDEQSAALASAVKVNADHRNGLIEKIVANSAITKEVAEAMSTNALEQVAASVTKPAANFGGRSIPHGGLAAHSGLNDADLTKQMVDTGVVSFFINRDKAA